MRSLSLLLAASLLAATPAGAQDGEAQDGEKRGGPILPSDEELRALGDYATDLMRRFAERVDPMVEDLRGLIDDLGAYEAPERLPNGDIILRRKPDAPPPGPPSDRPNAPVLDPDKGVAL